MNAGNDDLPRSFLCQTRAERRQLALGKIFAVGLLCQNACLGQIRGQQICKAQQLVHAPGKLLRIGRIELSVVAHHRVDQHFSSLRFEARKKFFDDIDLPRRAEKTGCSAVKG